MKSAFALLALLVTVPVLAQTPVLEQSVQTETILCNNASQSKTVISPTGLRASVGIRTRNVTPDSGSDLSCEVTLVLHIASGKVPEQTITMAKFRDIEWEFTFEILGFSRDGTLMLGRLYKSIGDGFEIMPFIYDIHENKAHAIAADTLLKPMTRGKCRLSIDPNGFTTNGKPVVSIGATEEDYLAPGTKPCYRRGLWELDYKQQRVTRAPDGLETKNFGEVSEGD